ncbi:C40 family peptidase [Cohnella sp.]|uniref:C40 family peptidase n=1 Tax=Cohnella sp. TaxID=1883426 RepID=UPI0035620BBE
MRKHIAGLLAAGLLLSGLSFVPTVSADSLTAVQNVEDKRLTPELEGANDTKDELNSGITNEETSKEGAGGTQASDPIEKVIAAGLKYKGTPYKFGSSRSTDTTFDCSDYVRWIFKETLGITLPADSRKQGSYVKNNGNAVTDWHNLNRGDLMFFMSYKGSKADSYKGIDKENARITHVGIYLGNGKILHTYSKASGGVLVGNFANTAWEHRFLFGGSALLQ